MNFIKLNCHVIFIENISFIHFRYSYGKLEKIEIHCIGGEILIFNSFVYKDLKEQMKKIGVEL